jgi:hypothetical protein
MWEAVISGLFGLKTTLKGPPSNHSPTLIMASRVMFTMAMISLVAAVPRPGILSLDTSTVPTNAFPACASTNCVTSGLLTPARLGCATANLTTDCLCNVAVTPLSCSPLGPSDQSHCWFDLEQWFSGVCPSVKTIAPSQMPGCMSNCTIEAIQQLGCPVDSDSGSVTLNCFCELGDVAVENAAASCRTHKCPNHFQPSFVIQEWRKSICQQGYTNDYDEAAYDGYMKKVKSIRAAMVVVPPIIACIIAVIIGVATEEIKAGIGTFCVLLSVFYLAILPPVYTAI